MPDRAHLWRGIHDPDMVRSAVDVDLLPRDLSGAALEATLVLRNRDVGHSFPTYTTPRVFLTIHQVDADGVEIPGTRIDATIGREVDFGAGEEIYDTRVLPGESVRLDYAQPRAQGAAAIVGRVRVDPDYHYRGVFEVLAERYENPAALELMREAGRRASMSEYVLAEIRRPL